MWLIALVLITPVGAWLAVTLGLGLSLQSPRDYVVFLLLAPLLEEYVFRSHLQATLSRRWKRPQIANIVVALVFMAWHWQGQGLLILMWLLPSLALGEVWRHYERLLPCVLVHCGFNLCLWWMTVLLDLKVITS